MPEDCGFEADNKPEKKQLSVVKLNIDWVAVEKTSKEMEKYFDWYSSLSDAQRYEEDERIKNESWL